MLAQLPTAAPNFPQLPGPPLLPHLLFENPWPLVGLFGVGAVVVWAGFRHRLGARRGTLVASLLLLAAIASWCLATFVTTDREKVIRGTRALVEALAVADAQTVRTLTAEGAWAQAYQRWERDQLLEMLDAAARNNARYSVGGASFTITSYRIRSIRAEVQTPIIAKTQVNVVGETDAGHPTPTWFQLDWDKGQDGVWRLRSVDLLWDLYRGNHPR